MLKRLACLLFGHKAELTWNLHLEMEDRDGTWHTCEVGLCPRCGTLHCAYRPDVSIPRPMPGWDVILGEPQRFDWVRHGWQRPGLNVDSPGPESRPVVTPEMVGPEPHA